MVLHKSTAGMTTGKINSKDHFVRDYLALQEKFTKLTGEPLPPCCDCNAEKLWRCSKSGEECEAFIAYCKANT